MPKVVVSAAGHAVTASMRPGSGAVEGSGLPVSDGGLELAPGASPLPRRGAARASSVPPLLFPDPTSPSTSNPSPGQSTHGRTGPKGAPSASASPSEPTPAPAADALLEPNVSLAEVRSPGAPRPPDAEPWRRLWDPLTATQPELPCVAEEFLGVSLRHTERTVLCAAEPELVGPSGAGAVCYQREGVAVKACSVLAPVVDAEAARRHDPFLVPRCAVRPLHLTSTAWHSVADRSDNTTEGASSPSAVEAGEWIIVVRRDCGPPRNNPYHCLADVVASYLAMRTFGAEPSRTRVVFTDVHAPGPYEPLWAAIGGLGVHDAATWQAMLIDPSRSQPAVRAALVPMRGPSGPVWLNFWKFSACEASSPLLMELRGLVLASVLGQGTRASLARVRARFGPGCTDAAAPLVVTVASRRRRPGMKMERVMSNERALVRALEAGLGGSARVQAVDLAGLTWHEQMRAVHGTTVLVGMHGAALVWSMFMDPGGGVVELHQDVGSAAPPKGIGNIAMHSGLSYARWRARGQGSVGDTTVDVEAVVGHVAVAVEEARRFCRLLEAHVESSGGVEAVLAATEPGASPLPVGPSLRWVGRQAIKRAAPVVAPASGAN